MLRRKKIILHYLRKVQRVPKRTELFKIVFLLRQETNLALDSSFYDFVPYHYGPYSFCLERELNELRRYGYINGDGLSINGDIISDINKACSSLDLETIKGIDSIIDHYGCLTRNGLVHYIYIKYPWFASRSKMNPDREKVTPGLDVIYTAGYEGESIDYFLAKLLKTGVERIIDVRYNPLSRKYGFSKRGISTICGKFDMDYIHIPDLGIPPSYRRELKTFEDYQNLLDEYENILLPEAGDARAFAAKKVKERPSSLLCFEADINCCHRTRLANSLSEDTGMEVRHL